MLPYSVRFLTTNGTEIGLVLLTKQITAIYT